MLVNQLQRKKLKMAKAKGEFVIFSESYYYEQLKKTQDSNFIDDIHINIENESEFAFVWTKIQDKIFCQIQMYDDCWGAFKSQPELFLALSKLKDSDPTVKQVAELLKQLGFKDKTVRKTKKHA